MLFFLWWKMVVNEALQASVPGPCYLVYLEMIWTKGWLESYSGEEEIGEVTGKS